MLNLIRCPRCEFEDGIVQTLAELSPDGMILVRRSQRISTGKHETTLIVGTNFELLCGRCRTSVFRKQQTINFETITQESFKMIGTI